MAERLLPTLERRLKAAAGGVYFDRFTRGRYATDASHYQIMPLGVVVPRTIEEATQAIDICRAEGVPVTARGGGSSQAGQTVNASVIIDCSKHLTRILNLDVAGRRVKVEPGIVLDDLNRALRPHGLWFPVDVSTASRATIGGMTANNSCGGRSLRYGNTRENVIAVDALLADGAKARFGPMAADLSDLPPKSPVRPLANSLFALGAREADEIAARFPKVQRRVGGYNIDALVPGKNDVNLAHILVGSEGTLAFSTAIELKLSPLLGPRALGACHFGSFNEAMAAAQHIVKLAPIAVELVDATMIELARKIPMFRPTLDGFVRGWPSAVLLVEFAETPEENLSRLRRLSELIGDLGFAWSHDGPYWGGVIDVLDPKLQASIAELRTAGLNIMMSMKQAGKPISFVEDCAVPLENLADYTARLNDVFERNGTRGTWYAHASVGCLHVRPVLNLRLERDVKAMRKIAEQAFAFVREYKGSHSGEHGDGIVRSEFHEQMFGSRLVRAFEEVKDRFDPKGLFNPGKIVRAPKFDDSSNFRYPPDYTAAEMTTRLDWSEYPGAGGGFQGAVEMCNNNGACRASTGGVMCPSYRVTRDERDSTRGRANTLRLAITGQLGPDAFTSDEMAETLKFCVSCKGCRRECPTGVDMARMKIEVQAARAEKYGLTWRDRLVAYLPHYAPYAAKLSWLLNLRDVVPGAKEWSEKHLGFQRAPLDAALALHRVHRPGPPMVAARQASCRTPAGRRRGCSVCRHVQPLLRARKPLRRLHRPERCGLPRAYRAAGRPVLASALLRPHVPRNWTGRSGARRGRAHGYSARTLRVARRSGRRRRTELRAGLPRRGAGNPKERGRGAAVRACLHVRGISGAGGGSRAPAVAAEEARLARPGPRPLPSEGIRRLRRGRDRAQASPRPEGRDHRVRAAAEWPEPSVTIPPPSTCRSPWPSCRCCRRSARPAPTASSSPTAPHAATRSTTAPAARRSMPPACLRQA